MKVKEIMTREVEVVAPESTLQAAAQMMRAVDVGSLPVLDGARVVGVVTDRDITIRATAEGRDPRTARVLEVMTADVLSCSEEDEVEKVAKRMGESQVRRLLVLGRDQRLAGIVSLGDLAVDTHDDKMTGKTLEGVSQPGHP